MTYQAWKELQSAELASKHRVNGLSRAVLDSVIGIGAAGTGASGPMYVTGGTLKHYPFSGVVDGFYMEFPLDTDTDITFGVLEANNYIYLTYTKTYEPTDPTKLMSITPVILVQGTGQAAPPNSAYLLATVAGVAQGAFTVLSTGFDIGTLRYVRPLNIPALFVSSVELIDSSRNILSSVGKIVNMDPNKIRIWSYSETGLTTTLGAVAVKLATNGYRTSGSGDASLSCLVLLTLRLLRTGAGDT